MNNIIFLNCINCNKEIKIDKLKQKRNYTRRKYCSLKCKREFNKKNLLNKNRIKKNCLVCNKKFLVHNKNTRKYCSIECSHIGNNKIINLENRNYAGTKYLIKKR